jgi:hypothetical protein
MLVPLKIWFQSIEIFVRKNLRLNHMGKILYRQGIMILCSNLIPKFLPRYQRMRTDKKSQSTIKRNIEFAKNFEKYLLENKKKKIEGAIPKDLEDFRIWGEKTKLKNLRMYFMSIAAYYEYLHKKQMVLKTKN